MADTEVVPMQCTVGWAAPNPRVRCTATATALVDRWGEQWWVCEQHAEALEARDA